MQPQTRKQMIQKIHIGKGMLKMTDDQYKRFLLDTVDKHSCTVMNRLIISNDGKRTIY